LNPGKAERLDPFQIPIQLPHLTKWISFINTILKYFKTESNQIFRKIVKIQADKFKVTCFYLECYNVEGWVLGLCDVSVVGAVP
jgi:hypothetical protein